MSPETRDALLALNRRFYDAQAEDFARTRPRPWRGSERVLNHIGAATPRVLDVGCGHARLLDALHARYGSAFHYIGVDASRALLDLARERARVAGIEVHLRYEDFVADDPEQVLPGGEYDLLALLGVLHHVPGDAARRALLAAAARRLGAQGVLALTLWRLHTDPRFERRRVSTEQAAALTPELARAHAALEPGDHLLWWGQGQKALRYCHFMDEAELERLLSGLPLSELARFDDDGAGERMNTYVLLRRAAA